MLCVWSLCSCANQSREGLTAASNLSMVEVLSVRVASNVTEDGYCIVRTYYYDGDLGLPVLSRLNGNVIEPVDGVVIATEPNYTHSNDVVFSVEEGLLVLIGLPNSWSYLSLVDVGTGEVSPIGEVSLSLQASHIIERSGDPVSWKDFYFTGAQSVISLKHDPRERKTLISVIDGEGVRALEFEAYPYGAWILSQDGADMLFLTIQRPSAESTYELMRLRDAEGDRLDVPEMELVTLSPEYWQMTGE